MQGLVRIIVKKLSNSSFSPYDTQITLCFSYTQQYNPTFARKIGAMTLNCGKQPIAPISPFALILTHTQIK